MFLLQVMRGDLMLRAPEENDIEKAVEDFIWTQELTKFEARDTEILEMNYRRWMEEREVAVREHLEAEKKKTASADIQGRLEALQEREELLAFFKRLNEIKFYQKYKVQTTRMKAGRKEEEFVEAPGLRNVAKKIKKK